MELHLIRHAESENNAKPVHARVCDPAITARGRLQADLLGQRLAGLEIDELITSPFLRTLQTTRGVLAHRAASTKPPVSVWHDVFENGGCYHGYREGEYAGAAGLNRTDIESFFARIETEDAHDATTSLGIDSQIGSEGWWGGRVRESESEMSARATRVIERFRQTYVSDDQSKKPRDSVIVMIAHADFLLEMLTQMLPDDTEIGPIPNTSVTCIRWDSSGVKLTSLNQVPHLPPRLVTGNMAHPERSALS